MNARIYGETCRDPGETRRKERVEKMQCAVRGRHLH